MRRRMIFLGIAVAIAPGCGWMNVPTFRTPSLNHPGTAAYQQSAAMKYDPYLSNELGPPIPGVRPPGFRIPPDEVARAQQTLPWGNWRGHTP